MTPEPVRRVERLAVSIRAHRSARGLEAARLRLEDLVTEGVRAALADERLPDEDGIWLVDRLELDLALDPSLPRAAALRGIETAAARSLRATLTPGRPGVAFLPTRADFLARFLAHLARGEAWGRWEYACFAGLRPLPTGDALRTALTAAADAGISALAAMPPGDAASVVAAMTPSGVRSVLVAALAVAGSVDPDDVATRLPLALAALPLLGREAGVARKALATLAALRRRGAPGQLSSDVVAAWVAAALDHTAPAAGRPVRPDACRAWLRAVRQLVGEASGGGPAVLQALAQLPDAALVETLAEGRERPVVDAVDTRCAGLALLLPFIDAAVADLSLEEEESAAYARLVLLMKCGGPVLGPAAAREPSLRDLYGLPPDVRPAAAAQWLRCLSGEAAADIARLARRRAKQAGPSAILRPGDRATLSFTPELGGGCAGERAFVLLAGAVLRAFARRLPGFGRSSAGFLVASFLAGGGRIGASEAAIEVSLRRPPLGVVLAMTGLPRARHLLPWHGGRPVQLRLAP